MSLLYNLVKWPAKLALTIYCKKLAINNKEMLQHNGPLLLACNHPNSFLDAIILCTIFKKPVYSLARGDAFNKSFTAKILHALNILPVYRQKEGTQNLSKNYDTFDACLQIFKQNGVVLIFTEALCINEWHLRPLKKGTARLAAAAWQQNIPLQILPVGINYNSFKLFAKIIDVNFGEIITPQNFTNSLDTDGKLLTAITTNLQQQLNNLVYEIDVNDDAKRKQIFKYKSSLFFKILFFIPAVLGWLMHLPFYFPLKKLITKKAANSDHYDSVIVGCCFIGYPIYLMLLSFLLQFIFGGFYGCGVLAMPLFAWCWVRWKD